MNSGGRVTFRAFAGHSFAKAPRDCRYSLSVGIVTGSGQTLTDILDEVEAVFLRESMPVDIHDSGAARSRYFVVLQFAGLSNDSGTVYA